MNYHKRSVSASKSVALDSFKYSPKNRVQRALSYRVIAPITMLCDALLILLTSVLTGLAYHYDSVLVRSDDVLQWAGLAAVVAALFITLGKSSDLYNPSELLNLKSQIGKVSIRWIGVLLFLAAAAFTMKAGANFSRGSTILFAACGFVALVGERVLWRVILADGLAVHKFSGRKIILIVEQGAAKSGILGGLARHGLEPAHQFILPADQNDTQGHKRVIAKAISSVRGSNIEEIIVGANPDHWSHLKELLAELRVLPVPVNLIPVGPTTDLFHLPTHTIGDTVTVELQRGPRTLLERGVKRTIDVVVAGTALLLLMPLFLMTAIAIKLDSEGPVIFRQRRKGFNGKEFVMLKFRTMKVQEDGPVVVQASREDPRVTPIGRFLRAASIDELPQLLNVLTGEMSLIGPRPHALAHDSYFEKILEDYAFRHHVKPGLTGWAQCNGSRGATPTVEAIAERVKLDLWYVNNWSLWLDVQILIKTFFEVARKRNAY